MILHFYATKKGRHYAHPIINVREYSVAINPTIV